MTCEVILRRVIIFFKFKNWINNITTFGDVYSLLG